MAFSWQEALIGVALPVAGGVLTYLATAALAARARRKQEQDEYGRLHSLVYALVDDAMSAADQVTAAEAVMAGGKPVMDPWAITNDYWIMVKTRYAELAPSAEEVHGLSRFFSYAAELARISRNLMDRGWARDLTPASSSVSGGASWTISKTVIANLRDKMSEQATKLKTTYWHPDYKPRVFPQNPNVAPADAKA